MPNAVDVICPACRHTFVVPEGIAEATCPACSENIVWRRCLNTDEIFAVLTSWETWVHPGCSSEHQVDLTVHIQQPAGQSGAQPPVADAPPWGQAPASQLVLAHAEWSEGAASGELVVAAGQLAIIPDDASAAQVPVAQLADITGYDVGPVNGEDHGKKRRLLRRGKAEDGEPALRISIATSGGQRTIVGHGDAEWVRAQLSTLMPHANAPQGPPLEG